MDDPVIKGAVIIAAAIIFSSFMMAVTIEEARKQIARAIRDGKVEPLDHHSSIANALNKLGGDISAIRRQLRGEPDPPTFEDWVEEMKARSPAEPAGEDAPGDQLKNE